jgi:hypothetical protein
MNLALSSTQHSNASRTCGWGNLLASVFVSLAACGVCGCSKSGLETAKVRGTVKFNGGPVKKGTVMFVPEAGRAGHGVIQQDGTFYVTTYHDGDGAVVGENKISVFVPLDENATPEETAKFRLPAKYATTSSSGLVWNVRPGEVNEVHLDLKSN